MTSAVASSLYDLADIDETNTDVGQDALYDAFDRLIEVDLDHMDRMYELRQRSASLIGLLSLVPKQMTLADVYKIEQEIQRNMTVLQRRVAEVNDPGRRQQGLDLLRMVNTNTLASTTDNLFELQRSNINVHSQLVVLNWLKHLKNKLIVPVELRVKKFKRLLMKRVLLSLVAVTYY